jgi:hypothetical protein
MHGWRDAQLRQEVIPLPAPVARKSEQGVAVRMTAELVRCPCGPTRPLRLGARARAPMRLSTGLRDHAAG